MRRPRSRGSGFSSDICAEEASSAEISRSLSDSMPSSDPGWFMSVIRGSSFVLRSVSSSADFPAADARWCGNCNPEYHADDHCEYQPCRHRQKVLPRTKNEELHFFYYQDFFRVIGLAELHFDDLAVAGRHRAPDVR